MTLRSIRFASSSNHVTYDDSTYDSAIETDQPIKAGTPVDANDVLRLGDLTATIDYEGLVLFNYYLAASF